MANTAKRQQQEAKIILREQAYRQALMFKHMGVTNETIEQIIKEYEEAK